MRSGGQSLSSDAAESADARDAIDPPQSAGSALSGSTLFAAVRGSVTLTAKTA
jgi:hypothetical protein